MEIRAEQLQIGYGDYIAVRDMDIQVKKGEITTIVGPNGSGKSTVLKALTRLLKYQKGAVWLNQQDLNRFESKQLAQHVGVLPQKHSAPPDFKVRDLVGYGRMPYQKWYSKNSGEDEKVIDWALEVTGTASLQDKLIQECSAENRSGSGLQQCSANSR